MKVWTTRLDLAEVFGITGALTNMEIISKIIKKKYIYYSSVSLTGTDVKFIKLHTSAVPWAKRQTERWIERNSNDNENSNCRAVCVTVWLIYQHLLCYNFALLTQDIWYAIMNYFRQKQTQKRWTNSTKMQPDSTGESNT